ncbi:MAG TPA: WbqC family protein [Anaerolineaceae bacterium]|nr:WbqC family protein [Anaerolineaceae bacterium]
MICVILQPSYIPWRGYFDLIDRADVFVFYDDVQYDQHGWRNRNRIKTSRGSEWLTIPIQKQGILSQGMPICEVRPCWDRPWNRSHWDKLRLAYQGAPYFQRYAGLVEPFYQRRDEYLADFTIDLTIRLARELGIEHTRFVRSSSLGATGAKTERLIQVLAGLGATHYISGPSARSYIEPEKFAAAGIGLEYIAYAYPEYPQLYPPYDPQVSILDLLFMTGPAALANIRAFRGSSTPASSANRTCPPGDSSAESALPLP